MIRAAVRFRHQQLTVVGLVPHKRSATCSCTSSFASVSLPFKHSQADCQYLLQNINLVSPLEKLSFPVELQLYQHGTMEVPARPAITARFASVTKRLRLHYEVAGVLLKARCVLIKDLP